jgi:TetR/AcrR family transcriptional regulator, regulator of cefoperazone and chloramphenicol sensitivity
MRRRADDSKREDALATRAKLLNAGVRIFASKGYEEASVREIARISGVNVSMVSYHFQGKAGLYKAVIQHIVEAGEAATHGMLRSFQIFLTDPDPNPQIATAMVQSLLLSILETTRDPDTFALARIMMREQLDPSPFGRELHAHLVQPLIEALAGLLAAASRRPTPSRDDLVQAFALLGQVIVLRTLRDSTIRILGNQTATSDDVSVIMNLIRRQTEAV